jgi:hypothetical protein
LATQSVNLSVSDFQKEIQEKHLSKLMSVQLLLDPSRKDSIDQKKKASKVLIITVMLLLLLLLVICGRINLQMMKWLIG